MSRSLESILRTVRGLIDRSEHPSTPPEEAKACKLKADALMLDYSIEEATLNASRPASSQVRPGKSEIEICDAGSPYEMVITRLVQTVAIHCRCQVVFTNLNLGTQGQIYDLKCKAVVFGFEADREYFNLLFTVLHLHMASGFDPKPERSLSDGENAYILHNAGLNWRQMAREFYPWHKMGWDGKHDEENWGRYGNYWRTQYNAEVKRRGEQPVSLPKFSDSPEKLINYRFNFAQSYCATIDQRLEEIRNGRSTGSEVLLASAFDRIKEVINETFPNLTAVRQSNRPIGFSADAWRAGKIHGDRADLNATPRAGGNSRKEL
jgi:hypothetical protein